MSAKTLIGVALLAVAIAAPEVLPGLLGLSGLAATAAVAAVEIGVGLVDSALLGPATPKSPTSTDARQRLFATLDTTAPRKMVFGITAMATDVRYQSYTGTNQSLYNQIVCVAAHKVHSIDEIWIDNEKAWTSSGGVQGRYVGYLTVQTVLEGNSSNGIAIDSTWTSSCTLTGCAYVYLQYKLTGSSSTATSPFQAGVSNRLTIRGHGALVYDPRLDSTVTGGSGTQRANDQTTWTWDDNASRNPALQELWYELGWKINSKLSVGKGVPSSRLDLASYITAANLCDETVSLKAGGSEPRYRSDGVVSEGDDPKSVRDSICATMNATLRDNGGSISLQVLHNDLSSIVANFTQDDIISEEQWDQTPALVDTFNIVRGKFVDASDNALYQLSDYPEQSTTSPDGIDRINSFDSGMVQSATQMQRLAKLRLMRNQFQGRYQSNMKPKAWQANVGNVATQTHSSLSWSSKLFRVVGQTVSITGSTKMTMQEEDASIYLWTPSTDEKTGVTAGTPIVADPANNPLIAPTTADISALIANSHVFNPDPTTPILAATDTIICIKTHQRVYSDETVSVTGNGTGGILDETGALILDESGVAIQDETGSGSGITGLTAGTTYYVGYNDPTRAGGNVTYVVSTDIFDVTNSGAGGSLPYMHYVGAVQTAGAGSGTTNAGSPAAPPGYSGITGSATSFQ